MIGQTQLVSEGLIVYIQGHEFIVSNVRVYQENGVAMNLPFVRFTGTCTDSPRNDSIRNTCYNGGTYGGNKFAGYAW